MSKAHLINTLRTIQRTMSRFISIVIIVATGISFFVGITAASPDLIATVTKYFNENNLMDIRVQSTAGLTDDDVYAINSVPDIDYVAPQKFVDALVWVNGEIESDIDGSQISARAYGIDINKLADLKKGKNDGSFMNRPTLIKGEYPAAINECLVDASDLSTPESYKIGSEITLGGDGESIDAYLSVNTFIISGIIRTPYYISFERGNCLIGSGKIGTFIYIPDEAILNDYYSEIYATVKGAHKYPPYSQQYFDFIEPVRQKLESVAKGRVEARKAELEVELKEQLDNGWKEYNESEKKVNGDIENANKIISTLTELAENGNAIYAEAYKKFTETYESFSETITTGRASLTQKQQEYNENLDRLNTSSDDLKNFGTNLQTAYGEVSAKGADLKNAKTRLDSAKAQLDSMDDLIKNGEQVLDSLDAGYSSATVNDPAFQTALSFLDSFSPSGNLFEQIMGLTAQGLAGQAINVMSPMLDEYKANQIILREKLNESQKEYDAKEKELKDAQALLVEVTRIYNEKDDELKKGRDALEKAYGELGAYDKYLDSAGYNMMISRVEAQQQLSELL
ncbi:MAG: hypothetical protein FWF08_10105, partial [Oscillospiraceae bacterium]|nr:hypothetical protein [Oscillospiraceae bacterium]